MGVLTKLDNGIQAFKSVFNSETPPLYARLNDGTHTYNYETERFGLLGLLGMGQEYGRPKENLKYYYKNTLFLQDCINLYADFASQVNIMEVDEEGNEIENSEFVKLLNNPNPYQNRTEFIKEMVINCLSTGSVWQWGNFFKNGNLRVNPLLYNLEYNNLSFPKVKDRYALKRTDINDLTIKEHLDSSVKPRNLNLSELAFFYDTISNGGFGDKGYDAESYFKPISRLFSIMSSINTLINAQSSMEYMAGNNVNSILSRNSSTGLAPLDGDQKSDIETKVSGRGQYGTKMGKSGDIIATNEDLKLLNVTRDNRKMQMIEMKESAKDDIRNNLLIPKDFFGDSTYENKQFSEARFILGQVKTITDNWLNALENKSPLYFESRKTRLVGLYDHIPSVSETKNVNENKGFNDRAMALNTALNTFGTFKEITGQSITWEEFCRKNQFNEYLMIEQ